MRILVAVTCLAVACSPPVALPPLGEAGDVDATEASDSAPIDAADDANAADVIDAPIAMDESHAPDAVADVPPIDAGPIAFDLADMSYGPRPLGVAVYAATCAPSMPMCSPTHYADGTLQSTTCFRGQFSVMHSCQSPCVSVGGAVSTGVTDLALTDGAGAVIARPSTVSTDVGPIYTMGGAMFRNFHIRFTLNPAGAPFGVDGIPGVTTQSDAGDIWVMGCPY